MDPRTIDDAINKAVEQAALKGWEPVVLIVVIIGLIGLTGFIVKWLIKSMDKRMEEATKREARMSDRINKLEDFNQHTLLTLVKVTAEQTQLMIDTVQALKDALDLRPCLLPEIVKRMELEQELVEELAKSSKKTE